MRNEARQKGELGEPITCKDQRHAETSEESISLRFWIPLPMFTLPPSLRDPLELPK
jgi:hypothetical protein